MKIREMKNAGNNFTNNGQMKVEVFYSSLCSAVNRKIINDTVRIIERRSEFRIVASYALDSRFMSEGICIKHIRITSRVTARSGQVRAY